MRASDDFQRAALIASQQHQHNRQRRRAKPASTVQPCAARWRFLGRWPLAGSCQANKAENHARNPQRSERKDQRQREIVGRALCNAAQERHQRH